MCEDPTSLTSTLEATRPALGPEIQRLVDAGVLARAAVGDGAREVPFDELTRAATRRGELTDAQAALLGALLGLGGMDPANDRF